MNTIRKIGVLALFMGLTAAFGQHELHVQTNGIFHVQNGALVHVQGEVENETGGNVTNNGEIELRGDWTNHGSYTSAGLVEFFGNTPDSIEGNMIAANSFFDLQINKIGGNGNWLVNLDTIIEVDNGLRLTSGIVVTDTHEVFVSNGATGAIGGYDDPGMGNTTANHRYVQGNLRRTISANADYHYPVGEAPPALGGRGYQLCKLDFTNRTTTTQVRVHFDGAVNPTVNVGADDCGTSLCGSFRGAWLAEENQGNPQYHVSLYPRNTANTPTSCALYANHFILMANHIAATFDLGGDPCIGRLTMANGQHINDNNYMGMGAYTVGLGEQPFPVELLGIEALPKAPAIQVNWITTRETNSSHFELERSLDGTSFEYLATIEASGTTESATAYSFDDLTVSPAIRYFYRINMVDLNGQQSYSDMVNATLPKGGIRMGAPYPNPSRGLVQIDVELPQASTYQFLVYNNLGQQVRSERRDLQGGLNELVFDLEALAEGSYQFVITDGYDRYTRRLVLLD
ncbi:MAG: T9SS type A sorting domain-containing protein [Bacteroidota bacterium]